MMRLPVLFYNMMKNYKFRGQLLKRKTADLFTGGAHTRFYGLGRSRLTISLEKVVLLAIVRFVVFW